MTVTHDGDLPAQLLFPRRRGEGPHAQPVAWEPAGLLLCAAWSHGFYPGTAMVTPDGQWNLEGPRFRMSGDGGIDGAEIMMAGLGII